MIELTLGQIRNPKFIESCQKLMNTSGLHPKVAYHTMRVCALLDQEIKAADNAYNDMIKNWVETKEDGSRHVPPEKMEGWEKAFDEFHAAKVKVDKHKFKLSDFEAAQLTPNDFMLLEPLLADLELVS